MQKSELLKKLKQRAQIKEAQKYIKHITKTDNMIHYLDGKQVDATTFKKAKSPTSATKATPAPSATAPKATASRNR